MPSRGASVVQRRRGGSEKTSADKQPGDLSVLFAFDGSAKGDAGCFTRLVVIDCLVYAAAVLKLELRKPNFGEKFEGFLWSLHLE